MQETIINQTTSIDSRKQPVVFRSVMAEVDLLPPERPPGVPDEVWEHFLEHRAYQKFDGVLFSDKDQLLSAIDYFETGNNRVPRLISLRSRLRKLPLVAVSREWGEARRQFIGRRPPREFIDKYFADELPLLDLDDE